MTHIRFSYDYAQKFICDNELNNLESFVNEAHNILHQKTGAGNDFLGWLDFSATMDQEEYKKIKQTAEKVQQDTDVLLVVGIGGSYLGAKAAINMLTHSFSHLMGNKRDGPEIIFVGNQM